MKDFAPYQEALEMKELGFDEGYYFARYADSANLIPREEEDGWAWHLTKSANAPLYQQAFRWFREKYGLRIRNYVFVNMSGGISEGFEVFKYAKDTIDRVAALTYEEAELACLKKLIEIVKNK